METFTENIMLKKKEGHLELQGAKGYGQGKKDKEDNQREAEG